MNNLITENLVTWLKETHGALQSALLEGIDDKDVGVTIKFGWRDKIEITFCEFPVDLMPSDSEVKDWGPDIMAWSDQRWLVGRIGEMDGVSITLISKTYKVGE